MTQNRAYQSLAQSLKEGNIGVTPAELQGFLVGLIAGGQTEKSWKILLFDMMNDGSSFKSDLMQKTESIYTSALAEFKEDDFSLSLLIDESDLFSQIEDLIGWTNYFLLGLGLAHPHFERAKGNVKEAIDDLQKVIHLTYDEEEDQNELAYAFEEIKEYVKISAILCYDEFANKRSLKEPSNTVH